MKKELFDHSGHLTDAGLQMLISGELSELERFEAAEHLSYCDSCTLRYSELLCGDILMDAPDLIRPGVFRRIRQQARRLFLNRYAAMVTAAGFALVFWVTGVFTIGENVTQEKWIDGLNRSTSQISESTSRWTGEIADGIYDLFHDFDLKGVLSHEKK